MKRLILLSLVAALTVGCKQSISDYAFQWSADIKAKILEDVNVTGDSLSIDTSKGNYHDISIFHQGVRIKEFGVRQTTGDTILSIFYSKDQNFDIIRELCPGIDRSFEGIRYKGTHVGLSEFRFCDGKLKEQGYRYGADIGVWKEWDETGAIIKETDHGNINKLENLRAIKYYR